MRIHDLTPSARPRERAEREGVASLSDSELLAILLRSGRKNCSALELAQRLLTRAEGNLSHISSHDPRALREWGLGRVQAITILSALELGMRAPVVRKENSTLEEALEQLHAQLVHAPHEEFFLLSLNLRNRCIGHAQKIARGTAYAVNVDPKEVVRAALLRNAARIVVVHNHPSREPRPSAHDILLTKQLIEAAQWLNIEFHDHIIIAGENRFSFRQNGMLE